MKMQNKKTCKLAFDAVRQVIHEWDLHGLFVCGCPQDEFDSEIHAVVKQIERINSPTDATHVLSRVFSSAFDPDTFKPANCQAAGEQLFRILHERNLLKL